MISYKVHFENRFILLSPEPDRLQKYCLFHKFNTTSELYKLISKFQEDRSITSLNIYDPNIKYLWKLFRIYYTEVQAAGGLVRHSSGRFLFIKKRDKWDLPKGHTGKNEAPEDCALREVKEECGITGHRIIKPLEPSYHTYTIEGISYLKKTHWYLMEYNGEMIRKPETRELISEVEWLLPDELTKIKKDVWQSLVDLINKAVLSD